MRSCVLRFRPMEFFNSLIPVLLWFRKCAFERTPCAFGRTDRRGPTIESDPRRQTARPKHIRTTAPELAWRVAVRQLLMRGGFPRRRWSFAAFCLQLLSQPFQRQRVKHIL